MAAVVGHRVQARVGAVHCQLWGAALVSGSVGVWAVAGGSKWASLAVLSERLDSTLRLLGMASNLGYGGMCFCAGSLPSTLN